MKGCFLFFGSSTLRFLGMSSPYRNPPNQKQLYIYIKIIYDDKCDYTPAHGQNTQTDFSLEHIVLVHCSINCPSNCQLQVDCVS